MSEGGNSMGSSTLSRVPLCSFSPGFLMGRLPFRRLHAVALFGCTVALLVITAPSAQAQVVIEERVEVGGAERGGSPYTVSFIAADDGFLVLGYGFMARAGSPFPTDGSVRLRTVVNDTLVATDSLMLRPWSVSSTIRHCNQIPYEEYYYSLEETYTPVEVETGDEVAFVFETDQGTYGDDPAEGGVSGPDGSGRYDVQIGVYNEVCDYFIDFLQFSAEVTPCPPGATARGGGSCTAPQVRFIRQQGNPPVPTEAEDPDNAVLMVSKKVTTADLPEGPTIFAGDAGLSDPDSLTYRLEVDGLVLQSGQELAFRLRVEGSTSNDFTYGSVVDPEDETRFRSDAYIRLVSNGPPATGAEPGSEVYDDQVRGDQTVLVRLGDTVTAEVLVDEEVVAQTQLPVGRPPAEDGVWAIRTAHLRFHTQAGTSPPMNTAPQIMTERASEDWAQAGIRFSNTYEGTFAPDENALVVDGTAPNGEVASKGYITFKVECAPMGAPWDFVSVRVQEGQHEADIAASVAQNISMFGRFDATPLRDNFQDFSSTERWLVVAGCEGGDAIFTNINDGHIQDLDIYRFAYSSEEWLYSELNLIGYNYGDGQDDTIEIFAVPDGTLGGTDSTATYGLASSDRDRSRIPGARNALFITQSAMDGIDEHDPPNKIGMPFVLGHELGHILFDGHFDGDDDAGHTDQCHNLMRNQCWTGSSVVYGTSVSEEVGGSKRLTAEQHLDARADSGPDTNPPILKRE